VGPHSWKKYLYPPKLIINEIVRNANKFELHESNGGKIKKLALFGVRACELSAIKIQDKIFTGSEYIDHHYKAQRENVFIVAVNCTEAGSTCFCASMGTGPKVSKGFDLALTEMIDGEGHNFIIEAGSKEGLKYLKDIPTRKATAKELKEAEDKIKGASESMTRGIELEGIKELFYRNVDNVHWNDVGERCLSCGNCTLVCPTCFCSTIEDLTSLDGKTANRVRRWDSCFTMDFSYIHGGSVRPSIKSRYRQWISHKLAGWIDQFGTAGCVGCGRCIVWCPVGIDITQEARAIREKDIDLRKVSEMTEEKHANA